MQMEMNRQLDLFGEGQHAGKAPVADGVRRVRGDAERQQRFIEQVVTNREPLGQIIVRVDRIIAREIDRDQADCGAHSGSEHRLGRRRGKEVHVVETGDAATQHFGAGQQGTVMDELRRNVLRLGRPDVLLQPLHQGQVVGEAAQQRHRRVRVQIDESRDQHMLLQGLAAARQETAGQIDLRSEAMMRPWSTTTA
jgi:hypothetical protein